MDPPPHYKIKVYHPQKNGQERIKGTKTKKLECGILPWKYNNQKLWQMTFCPRQLNQN